MIPIKDFAPIAAVATVPLALTVKQELPVTFVVELIDYAKKNPGKLNYGSAGPRLLDASCRCPADIDDRHRHDACALQGAARR